VRLESDRKDIHFRRHPGDDGFDATTRGAAQMPRESAPTATMLIQSTLPCRQNKTSLLPSSLPESVLPTSCSKPHRQTKFLTPALAFRTSIHSLIPFIRVDNRSGTTGQRIAPIVESPRSSGLYSVPKVTRSMGKTARRTFKPSRDSRLRNSQGNPLEVHIMPVMRFAQPLADEIRQQSSNVPRGIRFRNKMILGARRVSGVTVRHAIIR
jgi:hypothetical protein